MAKIRPFMLIVIFLSFYCSAMAQKITINKANVTLEKILSEITKQTDYVFNYSMPTVNPNRKVSLNVKNESLNGVLSILFKNQSIEHTMRGKNIYLVKKQKKQTVVKQEKHQVIGVVSDENGTSLPGVVVSIVGTTIGDVTKGNGEYSISVTVGDVLSYSFIGYKTYEVKVGTETVVNVELEVESLLGEEVVIVGYGKKSLTSLTGSVSVLKKDVINKRATSNALTALQGALPGVVITRESGKVGSQGMGIQIRGASSTNDAGALIIIDGSPSNMENLELLNPNDIEDFTILKDAAASIYGARAAGGVVLVTTKKGRTEKPTINFSSRYSIATPGILLERATTSEHIQMFNEAYENDGQASNAFLHLKGLAMDGSYAPGPFGDTPDFWLGDHNWAETLYGNASVFNQDVSISGVTDRTNYYLSLGYLDENSILQHGENSHKRYTARLNYDYEIFEGLTIGSKMSYTQMNNVLPSQLTEAMRVYSVAYSSMPLYNQNGDYYTFGGFINPVAHLEHGGESETEKNLIDINLSAEYEIIDGLNLTARYGMVKSINRINSYRNRFKTYNGDGTQVIIAPTWEKTSAKNELFGNTYQNFTAHLNYDKTFGRDHNISAMAGFAQEENDYAGFDASRQNMLSEYLHTLNLGDTEEQYNNGKANAWALRSFFGRLGYSFKNKYFIDATLRSDGSSRFIPEKRWSTFYSASAAWLLSGESFIKNLNVFDNLKLRVSRGQSGNQEGIGMYDHTQLITFKDAGDNVILYPFGTTAQKAQNASLSGMVSYDRTWETVTINNIGLDFTLLDNRLSGTFEYYIKQNDNMLVSVTYPSVLGSTPPYTNNGSLKTWGWELILGWRDQVGDFSYYINGNIGDSQNELTDLAGLDSYEAGKVEYREGYPINSWFGYRSEGYIQTEAELAEYKKMPGIPQSIRVGDSKYADVDGNGKFDPYGDKTKGETGDLVYLGDAGIHYSFGLNLGLNWKGFDVSATFQGVLERQIQATSGGSTGAPIFPWWNPPLEHFYGNTWTPENRDAKYPRLSGSNNSWNYDRLSDDQLTNSAYVRLKSVRVGYTLPDRWLNNVKLQSLTVYLSGNDLWESSNLPASFDPELGTTANLFPFSRYYSIGLNLTF